jgi:hypothetical protein
MKNSGSLFHRGWLPLVIVFLSLSCPGRAATLTVLNLADSGPGSLRQAIADATPGDTINFATNVTGTITLTAGELLVNKSLTIAGPGSGVLAVSGNNVSRVFHLTNTMATVAIHGLTIANGSAVAVDTNSTGGGAGINNRSALTVSGCVFTNNRVAAAVTNSYAAGGGILSRGPLTIQSSRFISNTVSGSGAAQTAYGGAISVVFSNFTISQCVFLGNSTDSPQPGYPDGGGAIISSDSGTIQTSTFLGNRSERYGGAILYFPRFGSNLLAMHNCTFASNSAADGGAINRFQGTCSLDSCTVFGNAATIRGGGLSSGAIIVRNSIIAGNTAGSDAGGHDVFGNVVSYGHNLVGKTNGTTGLFGLPLSHDQVGSATSPLDPLLGPLQDNGGPTLTMLPQSGSPAIDRGHGDGLTTDQRGCLRPVDKPGITNASAGDGSDIGAVEVQSAEPPNAIPASLVSWWRAENNLLDTVGTNHGAADSVILYGAGKVGQAFQQFPLVGGGFVRVPASASLNVGAGNSFSLEAWINLPDTTTQYPLVEWNNGGAIGAHLWANVVYSGIGTQGCVYASLDNSVPHTFATPAVLQPATWHHVVLTYDKSSGAVIYVDGVSRVQAASIGVTSATGYDLYIGKRPGSLEFSGLIDEVSLYNQALSGSEVAVLYALGAAGKELPQLRITNLPSISVSLYWPLAYSNYGLESRTNLTTDSWLPVSQMRTQARPEWRVIIPEPPTREFFRLRK